MRNPDRVSLPYPATLSDLFLVKGKAELIADRVVCHRLLGAGAAHAKMEIGFPLDEYADGRDGLEVMVGCVVFAVPRMASGRQSFCPDVSAYTRVTPEPSHSWIDGPPRLAVEIRPWTDDEPDDEPERVGKRADYYEAGTLVVWDVDPESETVMKYTASDPLAAVVFARGDVADAEPAVPGWRLAVDDIFA